MSRPDEKTFVPAYKTAGASYELPSLTKGSHVVVIGAGAFGGWSALHLLRSGLKVTVIDMFGPGHSRSSSGDETRVIRSTYGNNKIYFDLNARALTLWKEHEKNFARKLFYNTGVLWLCYHEKTPMVDDSIPYAIDHQMPYEYLTQPEIKKRFPLIHCDDLHHGYFDPYGGYLKARESCQAVMEAFTREGGQYLQAEVVPGEITSERLSHIVLSTGEKISADAFLFACGSWLGKIFPAALRSIITCTKQEVYYFGAPAQQAKLFDDMPVWVDVDGENFYYGIANNSRRGFKIGVDKRGEIFDPTNGEREITASTLAEARRFIAHRFPYLQNAPLVESRVCPYENSPDGNFIFDLLPETENVFVLGGGSGHGFKHGPALGELVSNAMTGKIKVPGLFSLKRL